MASGSRGNRPPSGATGPGGGSWFGEMSGSMEQALLAEMDMEWQTSVEGEDGEELDDPMENKTDNPLDPTQMYDNLQRLLKLALNQSAEHGYMRMIVGKMVQKFSEQQGASQTQGDECLVLYHLACRLEDELKGLQAYTVRQEEIVLRETGEEDWERIRDAHIGLVLGVAQMFWRQGKQIAKDSVQLFMKWVSENSYEDPLQPGETVLGKRILDWFLKWQIGLGEAIRRLFAVLKLHIDRSGQQVPMVMGPDILRWPPTSWKETRGVQVTPAVTTQGTQTDTMIHKKIGKIDVGIQVNSYVSTETKPEKLETSSDEEEEREISWKHRSKRKEKEMLEGFDVEDLMKAMDQSRKVFRHEDAKRHWGGSGDPEAGPSGSQTVGVGLRQAPSSSECQIEVEDQPPLLPGEPPPPPLSEQAKRKQKIENQKTEIARIERNGNWHTIIYNATWKYSRCVSTPKGQVAVHISRQFPRRQ